MSITPGAPVTLNNSSISMAGGKATPMSSGLKGRVCKMTSFGTCWVQFENIGCRRLHRKRLSPASEPAPNCTPQCS